MSIFSDKVQAALAGTPYARCEITVYASQEICGYDHVAVQVKWFDIGDDWDPAVARRIVAAHLQGAGMQAEVIQKTLWVRPLA